MLRKHGVRIIQTHRSVTKINIPFIWILNKTQYHILSGVFAHRRENLHFNIK